MHATEGELKAAHQLADALVRFIVAVNEGANARRATRPKDEITVRVEQPKPPPPPYSEPAVDAEQTKAMLPDRILVSARDAAKLLSVGQRLLWSMSAPRGPIPVVRLGRSVRYSIDDLTAMAARMRVKPRRWHTQGEHG